MLIKKREGVQQEVDAAKRNLEKIRADVEDWCDRADKKIEEEQKKVKELEDKAKNKCFIGLCPNIKCRHQLSRKAEGGAKAVDELLQQGQFNRVSYPDVPEDYVDDPPKDFEAFESRGKVFNNIMEALKDSTIGMIGVYGMAGVGKTTLVNEVGRQAKKEKLFDAVVSGEVKQTPVIQEIQNQIADPLGLKFEEQSVIGRARRLCERLKNEKKILVVLDDLWARLDLKKVGIPVGDEHKGCTVLLTSRVLNVLNEMDAQKSFEIGVLEEKEARELLKKMAGDTVESSELQSIANEVAKKCSGLPLALATIGRALRKKRSFAWKDALRELQRPSETNFTGIPQHVYSAIALSYDHLGSQELRHTFLLCSLLRDHANTGDLLKYTMGLGLFSGVNTVEETRYRLLTVVDNLKASCLLSDCYYHKDHVHMHVLICDVAIVIASKDNVFALKQDDVLQDWPDGDRMKMFKMINLDRASITELPEGLVCPQLTFFHMGSKNPNVEMPSNFFMEMKNLKVLDLTNLCFSSLPSSISVLTNLRTFCLDQCVLEDIALIGELKNLEILSLLKSDIKMLPKEIGQLNQLRLFDLSGCNKLKLIPPGVLSSLSRLEELYMGDSFVEWEVESHANQQTNATLAELRFLSPNLTALEIHIPDAKIMPGDLFFGKLKSYKIFIGKARGWKGKYEFSRTLSLDLNGSINHLDDGIKMLLKKTEDLYLADIKGAKIAQGLVDEEGFQHLKNLHIQNCSDIQHIIDDRPADNNEFLRLQSLTLQNLPQLISFSREYEYKSNSTSGSQNEFPLFSDKMMFPCLKNLRLSSINVERIWSDRRISKKSFCTHENMTNLIVEGCGNLKQLLSSSMARSLVNLEHLEIVECKWLREIIFSEEQDIREEVNLFPQLNYLKLKDLPHLMGFCSEDHKIDFQSLKFLWIDHCPTLKGFMYKSKLEDNQLLSPQALFNEKIAFPSLEKLRIFHLRKMKMIWHNILSVNSFCKLTQVEVTNCNELATLFPCNMWSIFQRLETLRVCSCDSLEEIFELQSLNMEETHVVATQFRELHIHDLPKLKNVWSKDPRGILTFHNLSVVQVWDCWSLTKNVFPTSTARFLPQLKDLDIKRCGVEEIVSKEEGSSETSITFAFDQLSSLTLSELPSLKCFYPGLHVIKWPMLKKLAAFRCKQMKIFGADMNEDDGRHDFPTQRQSPLFLFEQVVNRLEEVSLNSDDIAMISNNKKFSRSLIFCEIKALKVLCYHDEPAIFPITFLERFNNLEKLEIGCSGFKQLFSCDGATQLVSIKKLILAQLNNLKRIWKQESQLDNVLPNLETLEVYWCPTLVSLGSSSAPFQNLMTLEVAWCAAMINLVTSSSAVQSLVQLKSLKIGECKSMKEVVGNEGGEATDVIIFNRLECMELRNLSGLESFCSGNHTFEFPSLEQVIVIQCPVLEIFCKGILNAPLLHNVQTEEGDLDGDLNNIVKQVYSKKVGYQGVKYLFLSDSSRSIDTWKQNLQETLDFTNLQVLEVKDCSSLTYIFTISMALSLVQLKEIEVNNCPMMEQIIRNEGAAEATMSPITLPRLESITLESCKSLTSFFLGSKTLECPSLQQMSIVNCPKMVEFISVFPRKHYTERIVGVLNAPFFNDKVAFPSLEKLRIVHLRNMKMIWHSQHSVNSFSKLTKMAVEHCDELVTLFPCDMWRTFQRLETLSVRCCGSLEAIFEVQSLNMKETHVVATQFRELYIYDVPKLKHVWSKDPRGILTFQSLSVVKVGNCGSLKNVFPSSIARDLPQLKDLHIIECGVEEVVSKEEGSETSITFAFDQLSSLSLWNLKQLKCFYPGMHTTELPVLKKLTAWHCNKVKIFDTEPNDYVDNGEQDTSIQRHQPLFSLEKVITKLEEVSLNSDDITMISYNDKFSSGHFHEVKTLHVHCYHDKSVVFPISFLERFTNLEKLEIGCCEFKELFPYEGGFGKQINAGTLLPFKSLKLNGLNNVKYIWKHESRLDHFLPNLETLEVVFCQNLISLGSCSAPFQNLMTLEVASCKAIINLVTSLSAIQSLVQLKSLKIGECKTMKEVVANEGGEATDVIIFNRLEYMVLRNLPSLESFCSGNHTFVFPSLEQVIVIKCPVLETFCKGVVKAPLLHSVRTQVGDLDGDLNNIVRQLYSTKVGYQGVEYLLLSDCSKSIDIWKENLQESLDFTNLQVLEVKDCSSLTYIFTISMALSLVQLIEIKVNNCPMMEQIIRNEGMEEATISTIMLRRLAYITLESCSSLTGFFLGSNTLECPSLQSMRIVDCPKMFEFSSAFPTKQDMERIGGVNAHFFSDKVLCPNLQYLLLSSLNVQKIWSDQGQVTSSNVQNLKTFVVKGCHSLKHILPSSLCEKLVELNQLEIYDCTNVEEVICTERLIMSETQTQLIEAESTIKFVFPNITLLVLKKLPKLKCFYSKIHTTEWPLLKELQVIGCNKVETLVRDFLERPGECQPEIFQQPLFWVNEDSCPNLEGLHLEENGIMEEIWHGQLPSKYFPKLNWLKLIGFPKNAVALPYCFIQSLPNLEKLQVSESFFNEIFQCEGLGVGAEEEHLRALARLKELRLSQLPGLRHLWKEEIPLGETFSNLRILVVLGCAKLENVLVPSWVSFKNLTTLEVSKCHGLKNLVTLQTARSMMLLERMSVIDCQIMEEIIASTSDEAMDGIVFSKLKSFELGSLPSLSRICSGNFTFGLPSLEKIIMKQCPKMEIFSGGELSTPMLQGVQSTEGEYVGCWEGDLNAIIRQLFVEKVFPGMEDLEQSSINIQRIWLWKLLVASSYAQNLKCLTVEGCPNLKCLFSSLMVKSFVQLKMLHINKCENVETIIFMEGLADGELMSQTSFRILESLLLKDLPKLTSFYRGNYMEFPSLRFLGIENCPTLKTFISDSVMGNGTQIDEEAEENYLEIASPTLFSEKVAFLCLEEVSITGVGKWRKIWHDHQLTNSVKIHFGS